MRRYAQDTEVSSEKSRAEIERILTRYGASAFAYGWELDKAVIGFKAHGRLLRFNLPMPAKEDKKYIKDGRGFVRSKERRLNAWEQDARQRWRALALCIKAKLEAVEAGISEFQSEFLAQIVLPNGETMAEHSKPLVDKAYSTGQMPKLLPDLR